MKDRTKAMFANELEKLLEKTPPEKIRVLDLCRNAGATPPTFYYHFHDKCELVAWIFLRDFADIFAGPNPEYSADIIMSSLSQTAHRKDFYKKAYDKTSQNSIDQYIQDFNVSITEESIKTLTGENLTKEQSLAVKYHSYGMMGLFKEWLYDESDISMQDIADFQIKHTPDFISETFSKVPFSRDKILSRFGK
jgi:hypothetical protein